MAWNASTSTNIASYAIHYGNTPGQYTVKTNVGNVNFAVIPNLMPGLTYYFVATSIDTQGLESPVSVEVSHAVTSQLPTLAGLSSLTLPLNTFSGQVPFTLSCPLPSADAVFRVESNHSVLVPAGAVTFGGLGTNRWLSFTPAVDLYGSADLKVSLSYGLITNTATLAVVVNPFNHPPVVDAGTNFIAKTNANYFLRGRATDDGFPTTPGRLSTRWVKMTGAGLVTFGNSNLLVTTVRFSANGIYKLRLSAHDGEVTSYADVIYRVSSVTDTNAPTLSQVTVADVTENTITLNWVTDELSDEQIQYSAEAPTVLNTLINPVPRLSHSVTVSNLYPGNTYRLVARSRDVSGNKGYSAPVFVSTLDAASIYSAAPADSALSVSSPQETAAFSVYVPASGVYRVWALVDGSWDTSKTFDVSVNGGTPDTFSPPTAGWDASAAQWQLLNGRTGGVALSLNPRLLRLTAASHVLRFVGAGSQRSLLRVLITNDPDYLPGQDALSCCNPTAEALASVVTRVHRGWTLVGMPLEAADAGIASVVPNPPAGTVFYSYDLATTHFVPDLFDGVDWADTGVQLTPGQGGMIYNPEADFDWVITGKFTSNPVAPVSLLHAGVNLVSLKTPEAGVISKLLPGFVFRAGDTVQHVRSLTGDPETHQFDGSSWDVVPVINLGEAFYVTLVPR